MSSWLGRLLGGRRSRTRESGPAGPIQPAQRGEPPTESAVVPVQGFGPEGVQSFEIETGGERVSDALNLLDDGQAEGLLLVVPPIQAGDPRKRLHRPGRSLRVTVKPYDVVGLVHVPPGAQPLGFLDRVHPRFVPLTNAVIRLGDGSPDELRVGVVIVNLRRAEQVREIAAADRESRARMEEPPS